MYDFECLSLTTLPVQGDHIERRQSRISGLSSNLIESRLRFANSPFAASFNPNSTFPANCNLTCRRSQGRAIWCGSAHNRSLGLERDLYPDQ